MAKSISRAHPLVDRVFASNGVTLTPLLECERISLRADKRAVSGLAKALGLALPAKPGTSITKSGVSALWIGPDEWFVTAASGTGLEAKISRVKTGNFSAVAIGHRNTGLTISGQKAAHALNSGCARDLSLDAFPIGSCSRTMLAKAEIILWRKGETEFHVECWRSFSDYVWKYLSVAACSA